MINISRAADITLFIIILEASMGFVSAMGLFDQNYVSTLPVDQTFVFNVTDISKYSNGITDDSTGTTTGIWSYLETAGYWIVESFIIIIKILTAIAVAWIPLVTVFHVPMILATFLQAGIYYCYALFYAQWKSGKGIKLYDY